MSFWLLDIDTQNAVSISGPGYAVCRFLASLKLDLGVAPSLSVSLVLAGFTGLLIFPTLKIAE